MARSREQLQKAEQDFLNLISSHVYNIQGDSLYIGCSKDQQAGIGLLGAHCDTVTVLEAFKQYADESRALPGVTNVIEAELSLAIKSGLLGSYDTIIWRSGPEHLDKQEGAAAITHLMTCLRQDGILIVECPNRMMIQPPFDGNIWNEHKSGWTLKDFESVGLTATTGAENNKRLVGVYQRAK